MSKAGKRDKCLRRRFPYISTPFGSFHYSCLILLTSLFSQVSSSPTPGPSTTYNTGPAATILYDKARTFNVEVTTAVCAAISMTTSFVAFYWFCRMEKRFRHELIMLLIYGDLMKTSWLLIFAVVSLTRGTVTTSSSFCQASGFFLQYGMETCDYSVLMIAIHSALQVFRPAMTSNSDGLCPYRYYVYVGALLIPVLMAGMAFVNPRWGYMSQGAFCYLPIRPFWYRLALAWIPRYIISVIILGLAIAIYAHVGFEFRNFSQIGQSTKPSISTMMSVCGMEEGQAGGLMPLDTTEQQYLPTPIRRSSPMTHGVFPSQRRASAVAFNLDNEDLHPPQTCDRRSQSNPVTSRNSIVPIQAVLESGAPLSASQILDNTAGPSSTPARESSRSNSRNTSPLSNGPTSQVQRQHVQERARIHRQVRLMFIYPLTYILMWIIPFVAHCMAYSDKWAAHPLYWLTMMSAMCVTLMGAVDCLIFSLREQPWRHIMGSDGTFWGSILCWRASPDWYSPTRGRQSDARLSRSLDVSIFNAGANDTGDANANANVKASGEGAGDETKKQMSLRLGSLEQSTMTSVGVATQDRRKSRNSEMRMGDKSSPRSRLEGEKEDRRIEKLRREMGAQEAERREDLSLEERDEEEEGSD